MSQLIYPELSYQLVGIAFEVYNQLGIGYQEKYYQRAYAFGLKKHKLIYTEQLRIDLKFENLNIGNYFLDFLVKDKFVVELKVIEHLRKRDIDQVLGYLKSTDLKLGLIIMFTRDGVKAKRMININRTD